MASAKPSGLHIKKKRNSHRTQMFVKEREGGKEHLRWRSPIEKQLSERGCAICLVHNRIRKCVWMWWTCLTDGVTSYTHTRWTAISESGAAACYEEQKSVVSPVCRRTGHIHVCLNWIADKQRSWTLRLTLAWGTQQNTSVCPATAMRMRYYRLFR